MGRFRRPLRRHILGRRLQREKSGGQHYAAGERARREIVAGGWRAASLNGGSIPTQLGSLKKLNVLALQSNLLSGAIPAILGNLGVLMRLDLIFNRAIPTKLADAPLLEVLDVRNNTLSGNVPLALKRLVDGFQYDNNPGLCGSRFSSLRSCTNLDRPSSERPEPYAGGGDGVSRSLVMHLKCPRADLVLTMSRSYIKTESPLVSLEYSNGWDPLAEDRRFGGLQEVIQSFRLNMQEVETATQYFADKNLLGKSNYSVTYRGTLTDGSIVAVKRIMKSSCKSEEAEFLKGLNILTSLRHENLEGDGHVLEWSTRVSIINGIAKGVEYLHGCTVNKPSMVHQNISVFSALKASAAMGYLAPEYTNTGRFTEKSDVYAFGVLLFQILSGKRKYVASMRVSAESCSLDFIDTNLHGVFKESEAAMLANLAAVCTYESPEKRPSMETIERELCHY
ncbi:somatic embryogenesis receptor kinase 1-like [Salvia divinorum]|uniref:non-specific serine/threonine protein kinase n=1 Tax=Salvia divinorum TaxID=28513 RepID=A0ABD1HQW2_SALDI